MRAPEAAKTCPHCRASWHQLRLVDGQIVCHCGTGGPKFKSADDDAAAAAALDGWNNLPRHIAAEELASNALRLRALVRKSNIPPTDRLLIEASLREFFILMPRLKSAAEALNDARNLMGQIILE